MPLIVKHECPQCGAPIELSESTRLLKCPYCNVENYLFTPDYFRFVLPYNSKDKDIIFAPYMRFKGTVYSMCSNTSISHRLVDITRCGTLIDGLPMSLGLRPQAMKLKFVTPELNGSFLPCALSSDNIFEMLTKHCMTSMPQPSMSKRIFHTAYIGESLSVIYLPVYIENEAFFDAITDQFICDIKDKGGKIYDLVQKNDDDPKSKLSFMATLCPNCGWTLKGEKESVVLTCTNCDKIWEAVNGRFVEVEFRTIPDEQNDNNTYLPFWMIKAKAYGSIQINSYADFIRISNLPKIIQKKWENQAMHFFTPAFKIRPNFFLKLAAQMTISEKNFKMEKKIPEKNLYPVTLLHTESIQSLKIVLGSSIIPKKKIFPLLSETNFKIEDLILVYIPFDNAGYDMVQKKMHVSIQKKALQFGRDL